MIDQFDIFYMKSFHDLNTCRSIGMEASSIPWTSIVHYAEWYGLEKDVAEAFVDIIREMDIAYLAHQQKERDRLAELNKPKAK